MDSENNYMIVQMSHNYETVVGTEFNRISEHHNFIVPGGTHLVGNRLLL